jgi:tetratricopeptide (TPR) repeat protein
MPYALMAVVYIIIRQYVIAVPDRSAYPQEATIPLLSQSIRNVGLYAKQLVYPPPLSINHQLPHQVAAHTLYHLNQKALTTMPFGDKYSLAILLFLTANIVGILHTKKITPVIFSSMWFLCSLLLSLPLITNNPNLYSERYAYLAIMGFAIGIGALFQTLCSSYPRQISKGIVLLLFSGYLSFLFILTNQRTYVWSSESGLLDDALTKTMHHPMLMYQRGLSYQQKGDLSRAQTSYLAALYLEPNFSYPYINLGYISEQNGDASTAAKLYVKASRTDPPSPIPWFNLAVIAHKKGNVSQSSEYLSKSLSIDPEYIPALELLSKWP